MPWFVTLMMVVQVICAAAIIILVLLQHGKGADMGAAFGSGASGSLFGATGSANFLSRSTAIVAGVFFVTTIGLAYSATTFRSAHAGGLMSTVAPPVPAEGGAAPAGGTPAPQQVPQSTSTPAAPADGKAGPAPAPADKSASIPK
jgi:preprotein translocase subunit SecG